MKVRLPTINALLFITFSSAVYHLASFLGRRARSTSRTMRQQRLLSICWKRYYLWHLQGRTVKQPRCHQAVNAPRYPWYTHRSGLFSALDLLLARRGPRFRCSILGRQSPKKPRVKEEKRGWTRSALPALRGSAAARGLAHTKLPTSNSLLASVRTGKN